MQQSAVASTKCVEPERLPKLLASYFNFNPKTAPHYRLSCTSGILCVHAGVNISLSLSLSLSLSMCVCVSK